MLTVTVLKPMDDPVMKAYNPTVVESAWYAWWEKEGYFIPEFGPDGQAKKEGYFVIPEPPPNVTGALHMGHALTSAIQDTLIRWSESPFVSLNNTKAVIGIECAASRRFGSQDATMPASPLRALSKTC